MTDVMIYWKDYRADQAQGESLRWYSNHRVFNDLLPGDRLWVVTSGKSLRRDNESAGYLVAVWPVTQVVRNPGDNPDYPARKYQHRILVNEVEAIHLDQPVCVDHITRREKYGKDVHVADAVPLAQGEKDEPPRKPSERAWNSKTNPLN